MTMLSLGYIGPGAGIAVLGSFFAVFVAILSSMGAIIMWPLRRIWRTVRGRHACANARVKRVVIIGLDGLEPDITERMIDEGKLPNLTKLRNIGGYTHLGTTCPPLSPVAWSSFSTGTNPGKHNIYDFITRNPEDYRPRLSSVRIEPAQRILKLGQYRIPISQPSIVGLRKSKPFWTVLGESGVFSAIIRVPITFPPDRFNGVQLSAMCVPDLRGSQGLFSYFTEVGDAGATMDGDVGGERITVTRSGNRVSGYLSGPVNSFIQGQSEVRIPFKVVNKGKITLHIDGQRVPLELNQYSDWVRIRFPMMAGIKVYGLCKFYLKQFAEPFELYCTPVHIDPQKPVMPISHPKVYSSYLANLLGPYATLGLAEDTWSLSQELMDEDAFLDQAYSIHAEREAMLFDALTRVKRGVVTCVFDAPDRIQHMFFRFIDKDHPATRGKTNTHPNTIEEMYIKMDNTVEKVLNKVDGDTAVMVMSDHGFKTFRRGVDINAWLQTNGYLKLIDGAATSDHQYLADVDWSQTRAYAIGLAGIYINLKGRESQGIVEDGDERQKLITELTGKLTGLIDTQTDKTAIREAISRESAYKGPYIENAPDLILGYDQGYRVDWNAAIGKVGAQVFCDNTKAWSGDHCVHPQIVPGVLFSNIKLKSDNARIIDIAPTLLELLGVKVPEYMDGRSLLCDEELSTK